MITAPRILAGIACALLGGAPTLAGVVVTFDVATINDLISSVAVRRIEVPLNEDTSIEVLIDELQVLGFVPASAGEHEGYIRTRLELRAPQVGLSLAASPQLALDVVQRESGSMLELRFQRIDLPLPFARVNLGPLVPPIRYPADADFLIAGATGDVAVTSRVTKVTVTEKLLRFDIALDVAAPPPGGRP
jgi:hypothetical protein